MKTEDLNMILMGWWLPYLGYVGWKNCKRTGEESEHQKTEA